MEELQIKTTPDFIEYISKISLEKGPSQYNLWFRSESNKYKDTQLIPNIYREYFIPPITVDNFKQKETNLVETFKNEAYQHLIKYQLRDHTLGVYFLMQHYGMHTRLLDWTENALISLFFAVENEHSAEDSIVWILDPYLLNKYTLKNLDILNEYEYSKSIFTALDRNVRLETYFSDYTLTGKNELTTYPVAVKPFYIDDRLRNQSACFTLFGHEKDGLRKHPDKDLFLHKVIIPKNRLRMIKLELFRLGISYDSIYPGLEGISKKIMYASSVGAC